jgi:serine/threonine protein phosphatase PrpC
MFVCKRDCLHVWAATDVGKVRAENEDCVGAGDTFIRSSSGSFDLRLTISEMATAIVVADGVGGGRGGSVAAELAVSTFLSRCAKVFDTSSLTALVNEVSDHIRLVCAQDSAIRGGSTTLAGLVFMQSRTIAFNVGDSRVYTIRNKSLIPMSQDHVSPSDDRILTKFLGGRSGVVTPYYYEFAAQPGQRFLVCTDGLFRPVPEGRLTQLVSLPAGAAAVDALVASALEVGAPDNVTVMVCDFE